MQRGSFYLIPAFVLPILSLSAARAEDRDAVWASLNFSRKVPAVSVETDQPANGAVRPGPNFGLTRGLFRGEIRYREGVSVLFSFRF